VATVHRLNSLIAAAGSGLIRINSRLIAAAGPGLISITSRLIAATWPGLIRITSPVLVGLGGSQMFCYGKRTCRTVSEYVPITNY